MNKSEEERKWRNPDCILKHRIIEFCAERMMDDGSPKLGVDASLNNKS